MADIPLIKDKIKVNSKLDLIKIHLYIKLITNNISASDSELTLLSSLYLQNGINNKEEMDKFFEYCLKEKIRMSVQSVRNILARFTELKVLNKPKINQRFISEEYLPFISGDVIAFNYIIFN